MVGAPYCKKGGHRNSGMGIGETPMTCDILQEEKAGGVE